MKRYLFLFLLLFLVGCSVEESSQDTINDTTNVNKNSPYWHKLDFYTSSDGINWEFQKNLLEHVSVPDFLVLQKDIGDFKAGTLMSVFVYFENEDFGVEKIGLLYSEDNGLTWSDLNFLEITGARNHIPVDPSIIQLDDGTLVLHYFDFSVMKSSNSEKEYKFYYATSSDGFKYNIQESVYESNIISTDPEIIKFNDKWLLYFATSAGDEKIHVITGDDYYSFTDNYTTTGIEGIPGAVVVDDQLFLYGCRMQRDDGSKGGITSSSSSNGIDFEEEVFTFGTDGCDPAPVLLSDGTYAMVTKGFMF